MERSSEGTDFYLLLQGTFLSLLAVSWLTRLLFRQRARRRPDARPLVLYSSVCDVLLCCLASLGCLLLNSQHRDVVTTSHQVTLYAALAMSSILSIEGCTNFHNKGNGQKYILTDCDTFL